MNYGSFLFCTRKKPLENNSFMKAFARITPIIIFLTLLGNFCNNPRNHYRGFTQEPQVSTEVTAFRYMDATYIDLMFWSTLLNEPMLCSSYKGRPGSMDDKLPG